jgi:hypothetical protein
MVVATAATGAGVAGLHAQTALTDPKDARQIFATTCSACHKSPQGLAKSGHVAGFLRQHYTTGPEMSAAMAAYLVAAGPAPAAKKKEEKSAAATPDGPAAKGKAKKQDQQAAVQPQAEDQRTVRGKQRPSKQTEDETPAAPAPAQAASPEPIREAAAPVAPSAPTADTAPRGAAPAEPIVTFDLPLPAMPTAPPADLTQSAFSSSPLP